MIPQFSKALSKTLQNRFFSQHVDRSAFVKRHIGAGVARSTNLEIESASGLELTSTNGKKYFDFSSGIGVTSTGHCHPKVVNAIKAQAEKVHHAQVNIVTHKPMLDLIEKLLPIVPKPLDTFIFANSGAEAVEGAVKLARHATKKQNVIVFQGGYHGRTIGTMSLTTSKTIYRAGFGPLMPGVFVAPFPFPLHFPGGDEKTCTDYALEQISWLLKMQTAPEETAAMLIEPIQGEGGYVPTPPGFLTKLKEICNKHNILLIADEVQTGFGRTGKWFAVDHEDLVPDVLIFAKGIASGMPLSGIVSRYDLMQKQPGGSMGGTYTGNAIACAAAKATIEVIEEENLIQNAHERGEQLQKGLKEIASQNKLIQEVRGKGLMIGLEFDRKVSGIAKAVADECFNRGMILLTTSSFEVVRFVPALTVSKDQVDQALTIFRDALTTVSKRF
eukprot:TRINITY_DN10553_c0_g1_i1.p1 TRINITY_DN10553_c0_g1~~TRINITY_DN10553_c0_g1_i1.p1  ORF type:complete len:444 (-),score=92.32 TRINITY_DN10553_c0_g1_i1:57-1388(-)